MPSELDLVNIGVTLAVVLTYGYVMYSALMIRKAMAVGLYSRHALGISLVALAFAADEAAMFLPYDGLLGLLGSAIFFGFALTLLYWVDTSILATRRSDPLYRDTFGWSRLRWIIWGGAALAIVFVFTASLLLPAPSSGPSPPGASAPPEIVDVVFTLLFFFPIYAAAIAGVVVMPVAARRSKDQTLRKHLEWFFLFIAIQLILAGGLGQALGQSGVSELVDGVALLIGLYPLYMSVKKLVPLYKFPADP
jgi:hypothetical protein